MPNSYADALLSDLAASRDHREELYAWFHQYAELSLREFQTAECIKAELAKLDGVAVTEVGETGLVAVIENGEGPCVAVRADIDGLPMAEDSGKDYAATDHYQDNAEGEKTPVAHSCGHDVHIMGLLGAIAQFAAHTEAWQGTLVGYFQPAEETAEGAQAMVDAGIADAFPAKPDIFLAQHVLGVIPGGAARSIPGPIFTTASSIDVTVYGRGSHGAMPNLGVDPVVLAASIVMRLQTVVAREVAPRDTGVITVGALQAGSKSNIIADRAVLKLNTRAYSEEVRDHLHEAIERIVKAECVASGSPKDPEFRYYDRYPLTTNDPAMVAKVREAFDAQFGADSVDMEPVPASEDFSIVPDHLGVPYVYWGLGGFQDQANAPGNHSPQFAPDLQPTLDRGVEAIVTAAGPWLAKH